MTDVDIVQFFSELVADPSLIDATLIKFENLSYDELKSIVQSASILPVAADPPWLDIL